MSRILIMDDNTRRCESLADYLRSEGLNVNTVQNGVEGLPKLLSGDYALAVIGFPTPFAGRIQALHEIRAQSDMPIVMIAGSGKSEDRIGALEMGADDCLPKSFHPRELKARIHAILRRVKPPLREACSREALQSIEVGDIEVRAGIRVAYLRGKPLPLTSLEYDVLEMFLRTPGQIVSREEIAKKALGKTLGMNDRSVDVHISSLRKKLGPLSSGQERIRAVRNKGYFYALPYQGSPERK
jgi:two-component system response regulator CpxR